MKILDYAWHQAHLYRLMGAFHDSTFSIVNLRRESWNIYQRPKPSNLDGIIEAVDVDVDDYDLALLHLDQWCDKDTLRALPFRIMRQLTKKIPQICIMHGTPDNENNRRRILQLLGDVPVVCNSLQAAREWDGGENRLDVYGLSQFRAIIHGYDVGEFLNYPQKKRRNEVMTVCSGGGVSSWYHGVPLLQRLSADVPLAWYGNPDFGANRSWKKSYQAYREEIAGALVYFSPTRRGPMPGARTEAMLSGACIVSVPGNDWEYYIKPGVTGFIVDTYIEARNVLKGLINDPSLAYGIGQAGRDLARRLFTVENLRSQWLDVLTNLEIWEV